MKYIILVGDGMGDEPIAELDNKTVIEAAQTPAMDNLCKQGEMMLTRTVPTGYPPGSDVANLSLLGYRPEKYYTGRAPLEAASMGVKLAGDEIAYRCNLVTLEKKNGRTYMRDYSAGHISTAESTELITGLQQLCGTNQIHLYPGMSFRHLLVHKGEVQGLETAPPHDYLDQDVTDFRQSYFAFPQFKELLEKSNGFLADHYINHERIKAGKNPANAIWLWGEGRMPSMPHFEKKYGISGSLISAVDLLKGIGVCCGLEIINVKGATGYLDTNYEGKALAALKALKHKDFVLVHVEAPDEAGHQGKMKDKIRAIEDFDSRIVAPIAAEMQKRPERFRLLVTMDHYTPLSIRTHVDWPVPMFLFDSQGVKTKSNLPYSESNAIHYATENELIFTSGADYFHYFLTMEHG